MARLKAVSRFLKQCKGLATFTLFYLFTFLVIASFIWDPTSYLKQSHPSTLQAQTLPPIFKNPDEFKKAFEVRSFLSGSMQPTLQIEDRVLIDKKSYLSRLPMRGDIVLFSLPASVQEKFDFPRDSVTIKRIIGLPGEKFAINNGQVLINNRPHTESYILESIKYKQKSILIPEDTYFVLGDNRNNSFDSHVWGALPRKFIIGKAIGIVCPPNRQKLLSPVTSLSADSQVVWSFSQELFQKSYQFNQSCKVPR
jgi:signal peptidase I